MNDVVNQNELKQEILNLLLTGKDVNEVTEYLDCDINVTNSVFESDIFVTLAAENIEKRLKTAGLRAVTNLSHLANDESLSANPRIRANEILLTKALEINDLQKGDITPANMTQAQLIKHMQDLQTEVNKRSKPVDTGVIEHVQDIEGEEDSLDDMMT